MLIAPLGIYVFWFGATKLLKLYANLYYTLLAFLLVGQVKKHFQVVVVLSFESLI